MCVRACEFARGMCRRATTCPFWRVSRQIDEFVIPRDSNSWSTVATVRAAVIAGARYAGAGSRVLPISMATFRSGGAPVSVKRHSLLLGAALSLALSSSAAGQQTSQRDEVSPRITRLEQWLSATTSHRPGAIDDSVRPVNTWNQEHSFGWCGSMSATSSHSCASRASASFT
jgi:hypothetical protein